MNKKVMRPLTEDEMKSINGGGWLSRLLSKFLDWILPEGKLKDPAIDVVTTVVSIVSLI